MYLNVKKYQEAIDVAIRFQDHGRARDLENQQMQWYKTTGQEAKAAELMLQTGQQMEALQLLLDAGLYARAAKVVMVEPSLLNQREKIATKLVQSDECELAGQLYEAAGDIDTALRLYRKGQIYNRAVELAREVKPQEVIQIERDWAEYLLSKKQADSAIAHCIEAGDSYRAIDAAVQACQWEKATEVFYSINADVTKIHSSIQKLANHFLSIGENEQAAKLFSQIGNSEKAVEGLIQAGKYNEAFELVGKNESAKAYFSERADKEVSLGNYEIGEKLFLASDSADKAITTYHRLGQTKDCVRLAKVYYPDRLAEIYGSLAARAQENEQVKEAEKLWIAAAREGYEQATTCCIEMYANVDKFEDAMRIAGSYGSQEEIQDVVYQWVRSGMSADGISASGVKIIERYSSVESIIERAMATDDQGQNDIEFARCLMKQFGKNAQLEQLNSTFAQALESKHGQEQEAEQYYIKAGKAQEAIMMWLKKGRAGHERAIEIAKKLDLENPEEAIYLEETVKNICEQLENEGAIEQAIQVFVSNGFVRNAVKIAMENGQQQMAIALAEKHMPELVPRLKSYMVSKFIL